MNILGSGVFNIDSIKQYHSLSLLFLGRSFNTLTKDKIKGLSKYPRSFGFKYNSSRYELKIELIEEAFISYSELSQDSKRLRTLSLSRLWKLFRILLTISFFSDSSKPSNSINLFLIIPVLSPAGRFDKIIRMFSTNFDVES